MSVLWEKGVVSMVYVALKRFVTVLVLGSACFVKCNNLYVYLLIPVRLQGRWIRVGLLQ